jgi:hypothetical protein
VRKLSSNSENIARKTSAMLFSSLLDSDTLFRGSSKETLPWDRSRPNCAVWRQGPPQQVNVQSIVPHIVRRSQPPAALYLFMALREQLSPEFANAERGR